MSDGAIKNHAAFIWSVADLLRGDYKQSEYGKVILPLVVLRRLDCVLEPTKDAVLERAADAEGQGRERRAGPAAASRGSSSTTPRRSTSRRLLDDPAQRRRQPARLHRRLLARRRATSSSSSTSTTQIDRLDKANLLYLVSRQVRRDRPAPGGGLEHRDGLPLRGADPPLLRALQRDGRRALHAARGHPADGQPAVHRGRRRAAPSPASSRRSTTRPAAPAACSRVAEEHLRELNPDARLEVFGQELNAETYAICRSDMMIKGQDASHIALRQLVLRGRPRGRARSTTCSPTRRSAWSGRRSRSDVRRTSTRRSASTAASARACRASTTARFLFLQHMISKMKPRRGGRLAARHRLQRLAAVHRRRRLGRDRDPPLDHRERLARSHRRPARPALLQHRHLHLLLDRHQPQAPERRGKVQLIDARELVREDAQEPRREAQGDLPTSRSREITRALRRLRGEASGSRSSATRRSATSGSPSSGRCGCATTVDAEARSRLLEQSKPFAQAEGDAQDARHCSAFDGLDGVTHARCADGAAPHQRRRSPKPARKALLEALAYATPRRRSSRQGRQPEPDPELRDHENVPLPRSTSPSTSSPTRPSGSRASRTAAPSTSTSRPRCCPYVPDAWVDHAKTKIGYEIPLTRHFYRYVPPRPLAEIDAEIKAARGGDPGAAQRGDAVTSRTEAGRDDIVSDVDKSVGSEPVRLCTTPSSTTTIDHGGLELMVDADRRSVDPEPSDPNAAHAGTSSSTEWSARASRRSTAPGQRAHRRRD